MKILFHHLTPFALAAADWRAQILGARDALQQLGLEVEFLRWYDGAQTGDVIHFFGRIPAYLIPFAHHKKIKVVVTDSFPQLATKAAPDLIVQGLAMRLLEGILPGPATSSLDWGSYREADACVAVNPSEARVLKEVFRVPPGKIHVVPQVDAEVAARQLKSLYESLRKTSR